MYESKYKEAQGGVCGITCNVNWAEPRDPSNPEDVQASDNSLQFGFGWFVHPIALDGKYPEYMRSQIDAKSAEQGKFNRASLFLDTTFTDFIILNQVTLTFSSYLQAMKCLVYPNFRKKIQQCSLDLMILLE